MPTFADPLGGKSRLAALLDHFAAIEDPRDAGGSRIRCRRCCCWSSAARSPTATITRNRRLGRSASGFLRRHLPYHHGVPGERWLTILMNRIDPALFSAAFTAWVRESWPDRPRFVAIDGKTSRRSHDRTPGRRRCTLSRPSPPQPAGAGQEAVPDKASETRRHPTAAGAARRRGRAEGRARLHRCHRHQRRHRPRHRRAGADWLLAVKANQPSLRAEVEASFAAEAGDARHPHRPRQGPRPHRGAPHERPARHRLARRQPPLPGRAAPARRRLPHPRRDPGRDRGGRDRSETRYFVSSAALAAAAPAHAVREHWAIENRLHWVLDVTFADDQSRLRKGHGARNMATVRHFALNLVRTANDNESLKSRRKLAGWVPDYLDRILNETVG